MKLFSLLLASAFAASAIVQAADNNSEFSGLTDDAVSDIRVGCIEQGI